MSNETAKPAPAKRRRPLGRRQVLKMLAATPPILLLSNCQPIASADEKKKADANGYDWSKHHWAYAVDISKCIGCNACMRACRKENDVPAGYHRTWVERYRIDKKGKVSVDVAASDDHVFKPVDDKDTATSFFVPKLCNHCSKSVCSQVCPVGASYHTKDGVVLVDEKHCVGCGYCVQACPYGCRFINPKTHVADKCTLCYHRITKGMLPACVQACPREARVFGDLNDPKSKLNTLLKQNSHRVLRPELGTHPECFYFNLHSEVV
ncbi:MAG: 4Fe-4S dicluster domain-containing protein [Myxococcales bacterium]|nr:4Fe-4S dicluster domain-containing protein [Myxococcales bacterium]